MKINDIIENSKFYKALRKSKHFKKLNHSQLKSGRFADLPRFTKIQNYLLESLYTISDMNNPSAYRLYLYLLRQITGFEGKSKIEYRPKKIKAHMNMGNSFYNAVKCLEDKNMIFYLEIEGDKHIGLNPYPESWITESKDRIDEIIDNEINQILGITADALVSSSSSSWSSSSSSSNSFPSDEDALLRQLDEM